ncbi:MAG TPA: UDP-N-acetylmuramate--L-alanine ligase [Gammaproteobacteria bacterium]|nr:UDP-N-acetylmuramate--L-alanine ligase [Gammaproteobacteria bacterium]
MKTPRTNLTPLSRIKHLHFVGIGGAGMGGIAEVLLNQGFKITGCDLHKNTMTERLEKQGAEIFYAHDAKHILGADAVVRSTAIPDNNPEIKAARENHIPVVPRAMMLGELMRFRNGIAIAGTHGKTTTTSLVTSIFAEAGLDPTFVIGGLLNSAGSNARLGQGDYLIAEADESDASFLYLHPMMTVVTNIDADHMETYHNNFDELKKVFIDFIHHLPFYGLAVLCNEDAVVKEILPQISRPFKTYGFDDSAEFYAKNIKQIGTQNYFTVHRPNKNPLEITLNLAGEHNVLNSLAAIAIATEAGIDDASIQTALKNFGGVGRRLQVLGEYDTNQGKILLIDDYGHHPREITATLNAIRKAWPERRVVMAYQPHRYTRTRDLFNDFANVLSTADQLLLFDVYSAGEAHIEGADSQSLLNAILKNSQSHAVLVSPKESFSQVLSTVLKNNDILLMQGAGDIGSIASNLATTQLQV